jgi:hypothetical protein
MVFIVDDDFRVREALIDLCASKGLNCVAFASAAEYLRMAQVVQAAWFLMYSYPISAAWTFRVRSQALITHRSYLSAGMGMSRHRFAP